MDLYSEKKEELAREKRVKDLAKEIPMSSALCRALLRLNKLSGELLVYVKEGESNKSGNYRTNLTPTLREALAEAEVALAILKEKTGGWVGVDNFVRYVLDRDTKDMYIERDIKKEAERERRNKK